MPHFFPVLASQLSLTVSTGDWDHLTDRGTKLESRKSVFSLKYKEAFPQCIWQCYYYTQAKTAFSSVRDAQWKYKFMTY